MTSEEESAPAADQIARRFLDAPGFNESPRRAKILEAVVALLAEGSFTTFTIRKLAAYCGISAQMIHNNFGSRDDLIAKAINFHTLKLFRTALQRKKYSLKIINLLSFYIETCVNNDEFHKSSTLFFFSSPSRLYETHKFGAKLFSDVLSSEECGPLDPLHVSAFGKAVSLAIGNCILEWNEEKYGDIDFQSNIGTRLYLLLKSILPETEWPELDGWVTDTRSVSLRVNSQPCSKS